MLLVPTWSFSQQQIPSWVKDNAKWWSEGQIGDSEFIKGIQYLVQNGIIKIPETKSTGVTQGIPQWIKNNAGWWASGEISEDEFIKALQYLVANGMITIGNSGSTSTSTNTIKVNSNLKGIFVRWTGDGDGVDWSDYKNWSTGKTPSSHDRIFIGQGAHVTLDYDFTLSGFLTVAHDGYLVVRSELSNLGDIENDGIITIDQGHSLGNRLNGIIDNFNIINNLGTIDNGIGNTVNNRGQIVNNAGGLISNQGIVNNCGGSLVSYGKTSGNPMTTNMCNRQPSVDAGSDQTISFPNDTVTLSGKVTDDGLPDGGKLTVRWLKLSGPGQVDLSYEDQPQTKATFSVPGIYVMRLVADDSQLQSSADVTITVKDKTVPHTAIISGPPSKINSGFAEFTFNSTKPNSIFKCSLDNSAPLTCTNPVIFNGLSDGLHSFKVRAIDVFQNADPNGTTWQWTVDTSGPQVHIISGPSDGSYTNGSATFSFQASKNPSTFECSLDNTLFSSCTSPVNIDNLDAGLHLFSVRALDDLGNEGPTTVNVWKVDFPPKLFLPSNKTIEAEGVGGTTFFYNVTAYDPLDGTINPSCTPPSGVKFAIGQTTVACSVKDNAGYVTKGSFVINVVDTMAPVFSNVFSILKEASDGPSTRVNYDIPTATDPIYGEVAVNCNPDSGSVFPIGTSKVTCTATDKAGNSAQTTFFVTVRDATPPTVVGTIDRSPDSNGFYNSPVRISWTATDSGSGVLSCDPQSTYIGPDGYSITISGHCLDRAGNIGKGVLSINYDSTPPTVVVPSNVTVTARSPAGAIVTYSVSSGDDVSTPKLFCNHPSGSQFPIGITTVTCTATDLASNSAEKSFMVTVVSP